MLNEEEIAQNIVTWHAGFDDDRDELDGTLVELGLASLDTDAIDSKVARHDINADIFDRPFIILTCDVVKVRLTFASLLTSQLILSLCIDSVLLIAYGILSSLILRDHGLYCFLLPAVCD